MTASPASSRCRDGEAVWVDLTRSGVIGSFDSHDRGLSSKWASFDVQRMAVTGKTYVPENLVLARPVAVHCAERVTEDVANGAPSV
jgi:hypothetical protein